MDRIWGDFGECLLERFWRDIGLILERIWEILERDKFWKDFEETLETYSGYFGEI